jgi:glycosyltransferase 2 family protein
VSQVKTGWAFFSQFWQTNLWFRWLVQWLAVVVPFFLMGRNLYENWQLVQQHDWTVEPFSALLSLLFLFGAFLLLPLTTRQSMLMLNHNLSYGITYRAYFLSQLAKYLPGGIWIVPGRILVLRQAGVSGTASSIGILLESYVLVITGLLMSVPYLIVQALVPGWFTILLGIGLALLLVLLSTPLLPWSLRQLAWFRSVTLCFDWSSVIYLTVISLAFWCLLGTGFFWLVKSLEGIGFELWPMMAAAYSLAWVAGFLVFLTPGGLGIREAAIALLLSPFLPLPVATLIALLARVWWLLAEISCVIIAFGLSSYNAGR